MCDNMYSMELFKPKVLPETPELLEKVDQLADKTYEAVSNFINKGMANYITTNNIKLKVESQEIDPIKCFQGAITMVDKQTFKSDLMNVCKSGKGNGIINVLGATMVQVDTMKLEANIQSSYSLSGMIVSLVKQYIVTFIVLTVISLGLVILFGVGAAMLAANTAAGAIPLVAGSVGLVILGTAAGPYTLYKLIKTFINNLPKDSFYKPIMALKNSIEKEYDGLKFKLTTPQPLKTLLGVLSNKNSGILNIQMTPEFRIG